MLGAEIAEREKLLLKPAVSEFLQRENVQSSTVESIAR